LNQIYVPGNKIQQTSLTGHESWVQQLHQAPDRLWITPQELVSLTKPQPS